MILIDMNQIAVANLMMNLKMNNSKTVDENMVRHMILNSIRMYRTEHRNEYGEVVLTWDSKHSWRRDYFPEYKASRRKGREESNLDWDDIFATLNKIRNEIKENFCIYPPAICSSPNGPEFFMFVPFSKLGKPKISYPIID